MMSKNISVWMDTAASASLGPLSDRSNPAELKSSLHVSPLSFFFFQKETKFRIPSLSSVTVSLTVEKESI